MRFWSRQSWSGLLSRSLSVARGRRKQCAGLANFERLESREMLTSFLVTSTDDTTDSGTLRWAIQSANDNPGADTIAFDSAFDSSQRINLLIGQLPTLTGPTTISGPGAEFLTISGLGAYRAFQIADGAVVSIDGLTITDGFASQIIPDNGIGGGILNYGHLILSDIILTGNHADYSGGSIFNAGQLTISESTISQSTASSGGGVHSTGTFIASHVEFLDNMADGGGAIYAEEVSLLSYCVIEGNTASGWGGGGIFQAETDSAVMTISYSTIANNSGGSGGGILSRGAVTITYSTMNDNTAYEGGAVYNWGRLTLGNSTVAENSAEYGGGLLNLGLMHVVSSTISLNTANQDGGGILQYTPDLPLILSSTIVFANSGNGIADNVSGVIDVNNSSGNLFGPGSSGFWAQNRGNDRNLIFAADEDIGLGPLRDNGGVTQTMALLPDSPAIDAGDGILRFGPGFENDQRGFSRFRGTGIDIGAFESSFSQGRSFIQENLGGLYYVIDFTRVLDLSFYPTTYTLSGGEDRDQFSLEPETGALRFLSAMDYEHPLDANSDNFYQIEVTLADTDGHTITIPWVVEVEDQYESSYVTVSGQPLTYQVGQPPVQDAEAEFHAAADTWDYTGSKLVVSITENRSLKDVVRIISQGSGAGQVSTKGKKILYGGIVIGTVQGGSRANPNLVVTFNSAASESAITALLKQVGFSTKDKRLPQAARLIKMQVTDLAGTDSEWSLQQVNVVGRS